MKPEYYIKPKDIDRLKSQIKALEFLEPSVKMPRSVTHLVSHKNIDILHQVWKEQKLEPLSASVIQALSAIKHGSIEPYAKLLKKLELRDRTVAVSAAAQRGYDSEDILIKQLKESGAFNNAKEHRQKGFCKKDELDLFNVHPDLVLEKNGKLQLFEIKSTSLHVPLRIDELNPAYYYQVQMYMRALRIHEAHIIYIGCSDTPDSLTGLTRLKISDIILTVPKNVNWISYIEKEMRILYKYMIKRYGKKKLDHSVQF